MNDHEAQLKILKALSEPMRLTIIDMLPCGEVCACNILEGLSVTQSTLSHHMKVLMDCGLMSGRKEATWMHYTINMGRVEQIHQYIDEMTHPKEGCICNQGKNNCCRV